MEISTLDAQSFYRAALVGLRRLEAQKPTGRRFGADADARWAALRGDLVVIDRIDLLIRDADAQWPGAFGARQVFDFKGVAEDDAFGPRWPDIEGDSLWRDATTMSPPVDLAQSLVAIAAQWSTSLQPCAVPVLQANATYVVAGASAIAALLVAFADSKDVDWSEQVHVVATTPVSRQLAGLGAALLNARRAAPVIADLTRAQALRVPVATVVKSDDVNEAEVALLAALTKDAK